jgi:glc operon protein GlcG
MKPLVLTVLVAVATTGVSAQVVQTATLTLDGARRVLATSVDYARTHAAPGASIAVVDAGGHLLAFERLDGSFPASAPVAIEKARTAALFRFESKRLEDSVNGGRPALITVGYTFLQGGVPVVFNGEVVGAVGVSGARSADQDREIAIAGAGVLEIPGRTGSPTRN